MSDRKLAIDPTKAGPIAAVSLSANARPRSASPVYLGALAASIFVAYIPTYIKLANGPWQSEQEGHGPLIMLAAAWLAWQQRERLKSTPFSPAPIAGWIILTLSLLLMILTRSQDILMVEVFSQIPVLLACLLLIGGWPLARVFAFPLTFLVFSIPPPGWMLDAMTVPLKSWISDVVTSFLYAFGYPIAQNGVMIMIGTYELMVKDACSGMNSIFALSAIGIFYVHEFVTRKSWFRTLILIVSIIPITILANFFRVLLLVLGSYYLGVDRIDGLLHDVTGIVLFVFALALFFLLDGVLIALGYLVARAFPSFMERKASA